MRGGGTAHTRTPSPSHTRSRRPAGAERRAQPRPPSFARVPVPAYEIRGKLGSSCLAHLHHDCEGMWRYGGHSRLSIEEEIWKQP